MRKIRFEVIIFNCIREVIFHKTEREIKMLFSQDIGIDLGTANTLVFVKGKGIVIREPSVVAVDVSAYPQKVVAVGNKAKQ